MFYDRFTRQSKEFFEKVYRPLNKKLADFLMNFPELDVNCDRN